MTDKELTAQLSDLLLRLDDLESRESSSLARNKLVREAAKASEHLLNYLINLALLTADLAPDSAMAEESYVDEKTLNAQNPVEPPTDKEFADELCDLLRHIDAFALREPRTPARDKLVHTAYKALMALLGHLIPGGSSADPRLG